MSQSALLFPPDASAPSAPARKPEAEALRPRWYQTVSLDQILGWYGEAQRERAPFARGLVDWTMGGGKGWLALELVNTFPELVRHGYLFLVEYDSIVWQQSQEFRRAFPHLRVDVEKANHRADFSRADIVVASVQTLGQNDPTHPKGWSERLRRVPPMGIIVYDEAHRIVHGGMGDRVLSYLGVSEGKYGPMRPEMRPGPETPGLFLALTATPNRTDGQGLHYWVGSNHTVNPYATDDSLTKSFDLHFMIQEGFLVGPRGYHVYTDSDLSEVSVQRGKFNDGELKEAITTETRNLQIVKAFLDHREEMRTGGHAIIFTRWVDHAYELEQMLRDVGVSAEAGDGSMPRHDKRAIERRFREGETRVLVNANLWSTGFNAPICDMVLHAEPTMSQNLYAQRCLDLHTEVLTEDGFKRWHEVEIGDMVAGFDMETGEARFVPALDKVVRPVREGEKMATYETKRVSLRVTDDHRMVVKRRKRGGYGPWTVVPASEWAEIGGGSALPCSGVIERPGLPLTDDEIRFVAWVMSDGGINKANGQACINQSLHQPYHDEIRGAIEGCGFRYGVYDNVGDTQFNETSPRRRYSVSYGDPNSLEDREAGLTGWSRLEPYISKDYSPLLFDADQRQFEIILDVFNKADGNKQKSKYVSRGSEWTKRSLAIKTTYKTCMERLQRECVLRGYKASLSVYLPGPDEWGTKPQYTVHIKKQSHVVVGGCNAADRPTVRLEEPEEGEAVWCLSNELTTLFVRREGKVTVVGNCGRASRATCDLRGLEERRHKEERLAKIAASDKPFFVNIDFIDQQKRATHRRQPLVTVTKLFGVPAGIDPKGKLIRDVKDRIDQLQKEHPTKKILDGATSLEDIEVRAERVNVWDVMETDPALLEASPNKWLEIKESVVQIRVPESQALGGGEDYWARAVQEATGQWRIDRVWESRWDRDRRARVPERTAKGTFKYDSKEAALAAVDGYVKDQKPEIQRYVERQPEGTWKPTAKMVSYLKRLGAAKAGISFTEAGNPIHAATGKAMTGPQVSEAIDALKALKGK